MIVTCEVLLNLLETSDGSQIMRTMQVGIPFGDQT